MRETEKEEKNQMRIIWQPSSKKFGFFFPDLINEEEEDGEREREYGENSFFLNHDSINILIEKEKRNQKGITVFLSFLDQKPRKTLILDLSYKLKTFWTLSKVF